MPTGLTAAVELARRSVDGLRRDEVTHGYVGLGCPADTGLVTDYLRDKLPVEATMTR